MNDPVGLRDFKIPLSQIASPTEFRNRSGEAFFYRAYPAWSENLLILYHGLGGDGRYLGRLARAIADKGLATVVTPDLRGHGPRPHPAVADLARPDQLEIDVEELLVHLRHKHASTRFYLGGHSLGAGLALKLAAGAYASPWAGFVALAPYLPDAAGPRGPGFVDWISEDRGQVVLGMPADYVTGSEVLRYEKRFFAGATPPADTPAVLAEKRTRLFVAVGAEDKLFVPGASLEYFKSVPGARLATIPGASHMGLVGAPAAMPALLGELAAFL